MIKPALTPAIEAAALTETEKYLREFVQAAVNTGIMRASLQLMLRRVADDLSPPIEIPDAPDTLQ